MSLSLSFSNDVQESWLESFPSETGFPKTLFFYPAVGLNSGLNLIFKQFVFKRV